MIWLLAGVTLHGQDVFQGIWQGVLPLVLTLVTLTHTVLQHGILAPKSTAAIEAAQELLQIQQASPQLLSLQQHRDLVLRMSVREHTFHMIPP